ncbi:MAG: 50S ribosomal protein L4, partial [Anaerolineales bacterium]
PRSYRQRMPKKMRRAALRAALAAKAAESGIVIVEDLNLSAPKTRLMAEVLQNVVGDASALILMPQKDTTYETVIRAANNLPDTKVLLASYLNIRDLLGFEKVVMPLRTLEVITAHLG